MDSYVANKSKVVGGVPSSMITHQPLPPPMPAPIVEPKKTATTPATNKKRGGTKKSPTALGGMPSLWALLLISLTLFWFFALHISPDTFYTPTRDLFLPKPETDPNDVFNFNQQRIERQQQFEAITGSRNLVVNLNFGGLLILLFILVGTISLEPNAPFCGLLKSCARLIPTFTFPGIAAYMVFEAVSAIWHAALAILSYVDPTSGYIYLRLALDALCCLAIAVLLILRFLHARKQPAEEPSASLYYAPIQTTETTKPSNSSTIVVSQMKSGPPALQHPGPVVIPMTQLPRKPLSPQKKQPAASKEDEKTGAKEGQKPSTKEQKRPRQQKEKQQQGILVSVALPLGGEEDQSVAVEGPVTGGGKGSGKNDDKTKTEPTADSIRG